MKIPLFEAQTEWNEPEEYPDLRKYDEIFLNVYHLRLVVNTL